jgi:MYXO-CTERM domain-containing protein
LKKATEMKKAIFILVAAALNSPVFADGTIKFSNRSIDKADGSGQYDVPIWVEGPTGIEGAGSLPGGVTVGLFFQGQQVATTPLRNTTSTQFFAISSQTAVIPGVEAGTTQTLVVREWQGPGSFADARDGGLLWGEQSFVSRPLGGADSKGNIFLPPTMTGWGPVMLTPEPTSLALGAAGVGALFVRRRK